MADLGDYVDIEPAAAGYQWTRVLARPPRSDGVRARQEPFTPIETVLCLAASLLVNHRRYGGRTSHQAPLPVPHLARLFRRTPASILAKMANLDGSRTNGARHEVEAAATLLNDPGRLAALYRTIVDIGRDSGITVVQLPDFLELDDGPLDLLGQDELGDGAVEAALDPAAIERVDPDGQIGEVLTTRLLLGVARIGQHRFARDVLANCGRRCVFCGLEPGSLLARRNLLRASHIKPWRDSSGRERLDVCNGLAACPNHDAAFDGGLLYVTDDLSIRIAPVLADAVASVPTMAAAFGSSCLAERLVLPATAAPPDTTYLGWHRLYIVAS